MGVTSWVDASAAGLHQAGPSSTPAQARTETATRSTASAILGLDMGGMQDEDDDDPQQPQQQQRRGMRGLLNGILGG